MNSINKNTVFVILILSLALGIGVWRNKHPSGPQRAGMLMGQPEAHSPTSAHQKTLPPFKLVEAGSGKAFTHENLNQKWSFLFFGYSSCPDICPKTIGTLNQLSTALKNQPGLQYLFISIHPEKDTPEQLAHFLNQEKFQPSIVKGLTGDKKQVMGLASTIGIFVDENPSQPALSGPIEHSGTIVLINPNGELAAVFTNSDSPDQIAEGFQKLYQQAANLNRAKPAMPMPS
jgi:protein SCO1/2